MNGLNEEGTPEGKYPIVLRRDGSVLTKPCLVLCLLIVTQVSLRPSQPMLTNTKNLARIRNLAVRLWIASVKSNPPPYGDPTAPKHRKDDPAILVWARSVHSRSALKDSYVSMKTQRKARHSGLKTEQQLKEAEWQRRTNPHRRLSEIANQYRPDDWEFQGFCTGKGCLKKFEVRRNGHEARHVDGTPFCGRILEDNKRKTNA